MTYASTKKEGKKDSGQPSVSKNPAHSSPEKKKVNERGVLAQRGRGRSANRDSEKEERQCFNNGDDTSKRTYRSTPKPRRSHGSLLLGVFLFRTHTFCEGMRGIKRIRTKKGM